MCDRKEIMLNTGRLYDRIMIARRLGYILLFGYIIFEGYHT